MSPYFAFLLSWNRVDGVIPLSMYEEKEEKGYTCGHQYKGR